MRKRDILVEIKGYEKSIVIRNPNIQKKGIWDTVYGQMFELPTWCQSKKEKILGTYGEPNWCEYLMWDRGKDTSWPMMLEYKYFRNKENDTEVERRLEWVKE